MYYLQKKLLFVTKVVKGKLKFEPTCNSPFDLKITAQACSLYFFVIVQFQMRAQNKQSLILFQSTKKIIGINLQRYQIIIVLETFLTFQASLITISLYTE